MGIVGFPHRVPDVYQSLVVTTVHTGDSTALVVAVDTQLMLIGVTHTPESFGPAFDVTTIKLGAASVLRWAMPASNSVSQDMDAFQLDICESPIYGADGADLIINKTSAQQGRYTFRYALI